MSAIPSSSIGNQIVHTARLAGWAGVTDEVLEAVIAFEEVITAHEKRVRPAVWAYVIRSFAEQLGRMKEWPARSETSQTKSSPSS